MKQKQRHMERFWSFLLAFAMVFTTVSGSVALPVRAAEDDGFVEVTVPNGDFESGETAWTFAGTPAAEDPDYYWKIFQNSGDKNRTNVYEVCSKKGQNITKEFSCSQTVSGLKPGTYKASVESMGGNDAGGSHTTTFTAGGKSVAMNPAGWNVWTTHTTDTFEVGEEGACDIAIHSTITGNYLNIDNVKLYRQGEAVPKEVDEVPPVSRRITSAAAFAAPAQVPVLYTDGTSAMFDVVWDAAQVAAVAAAKAGDILTVNGKVTVDGAEYDVTMTVEVVDASQMVQDVAEDALGSVDFDDNWQFYLATRTPEVADGGFAAAGVKDAGDYTTEQIVSADFDDTDWRTVDVPHDFSIEGEKVSSSSDAQAYLQGGLGYYRKRFRVPAAMAGVRTISLDFEGVYQNSIIYLNGEEIGGYPNGYTGFALDITEKLKYGEENVLVVKVQNMSPSGRWYTGSGIVRPVHLMIDNKAHFNRNGITLGAPTLEADYTESKSAYLDVTAAGYSDASNSNVRMEVTVLDAEGKEVAKKATENMAINPSTAFTLALSGNNAVEIPNVNLWYPWNIGEPYLYTVKVDLYSEQNGGEGGYQLIDSEVMEYGFRWVEIKETTSDPNSGGLYVNGKYTKVQGVDLHHDSGAIGAASYTDAYDRQFSKLMEMGVNAYRTSHCPPSKQAIEVCRRKGILVVEEAYDGWGQPKATYDFGNFFFMEIPANWAGLKPNGYLTMPESVTKYEGAKYLWSDWVIQEMVNRDKNEPSIIAWSIGNEVRGVGKKPDWYQPAQYDELGVNPDKINEYTEAVRLKRDIKAADGTRYVLMGGDQERKVPGVRETWGLVNQVLDGYGLNYNTAASVDGLMNRFGIGAELLEKGSKTFFFESESSSQTSSRGVYLDPQFSNTGINQTPGRRGGSNYDNDFASWTMSNEYGLKKDRDRKSFIGQFIWSGFDYLGEPTPYAVFPVGVSSFGTIDTAGFAKDSFYLYQSQWIDKDMVHLLPGNWDQWHEGEDVEVWVNSNVQTAELFLNGKSLGRKSFDEKKTAYGKTYYETSEKTSDDKTWGDSTNPGGYTSPGAVLDEGELNSGKLHLTWTVPYEAGTLEVKAYDEDGNIVATDSVTTSEAPYTIQAKADRTVLAADGSSLSYIECTIVDEKGNMVPDAGNLVKFDVQGDAVSIFGVDNGKQESTELYKYGNVESNSHSERSAYNGKVLVILKSNKTAGDAVLTISSDGLKPVQTAIKVTADGAGTAPADPVVTGTEESVDPVVITVPTGMEVTLPSAVKVNYNSNAGKYSVMRAVTWGALTGGKAEGTVAGCTLRASATVTEDAGATVDTELATGKASATASFTGSTNNYPEKMVDGKTDTSWTNAYSRGASVLLPANSASRKSEYVEFGWDASLVMNQIDLTFSGARGTAIPSVLEVQYWDGADWARVSGQQKMTAGQTVKLQFTSVYTDKLRVYMENATPFTADGNMAITEVSVKLSTEKFGTQTIITGGDIIQGAVQKINVALGNLPSDSLIQEMEFAVEYDPAAFENVQIALKDGVAGKLEALPAAQRTVKNYYSYTNEEGIPTNLTDFAEISLSVKSDANPGEYTVSLTDITATDAAGKNVSIHVTPAIFKVNERPDIKTETYLSDLEWVSATSGWNEVHKDEYCDTKPGRISLLVDGERRYFDKGLSANADSEIVYDLSIYDQILDEDQNLFLRTYVGIDYFKYSNNKGDGVYFIVYGTKDGEEQELYRSGLMGPRTPAEYINVCVTGVTRLRLVMDKNVTDGHDNGDWADAKLVISNEADKSALKTALDAAKELKEKDYTTETFILLLAAITAADEVYADENATQTQVNTQVESLAAAVAGLKVPGAAEYWTLTALLEQKEKEISDLQGTLSDKNSELRTEKDKVVQLTSQLSDATQQVNSLTEDLRTANERIKELEESGASSEEVTHWKNRAEELETQLTSARGDVTRLTTELSAANNRVTALTSENNILKGQAEKAQKEIESLKKQLEASKTSMDALNQTLSEVRKEAQELTDSLRTANNKIKELEGDATAKDSEIQLWKNQAEALEGQLTVLNNSIAGLTSKIAEMQKVIDDERAEADKRVTEAEEEAKRQKAEAERLKAEADAALKKALEEAARAKAELEAIKGKPQAKVLAVGDIKEAGNVIYRVTDADKKLAEAYSVSKNGVKSIVIADTVEMNGVTCKVTSIAGSAFSLLTRLQKVTIGKNVATIGKKAFYGDKKLKQIQVKSTGLKAVGKNAFKNINAKAAIKVPKAKKAAYKRLLKGKGQKKTVKIK